MLLVGAGIVTLVALFYAVENWRGTHAWNKYRRTLEARGEKLDLPALAPPTVPDNQNLAMAPVLKPLFDFSQDTNGIRYHDTNGLERLRNVDIYQRGVTRDKHADLGGLVNGTWTDLAGFAEFYRGNTNYPQAVTGSPPAKVVRVALSKLDPLIHELRKEAAARPLSRFPIDYDEEVTVSILLPHLATLKNLASALTLRAIAELDVEQSSAALAELELGFRLSDTISREPLLIDHLVRLAMLTIELQGVREGLARHAWGDAQLAAIQKHLSSLNLLAELQNAIRGERAIEVGMLDYARRQGWRFDPGMILSDEMFLSDEEQQPLAPVLALRQMPGGWYCQNMLRIARLLTDYGLAAVDAPAKRVDPKPSERADKIVEEMSYGPYTFFVKLLFPNSNRLTGKSAASQTYVDCGRIACALERYRLAKGHLPESSGRVGPAVYRGDSARCHRRQTAAIPSVTGRRLRVVFDWLESNGRRRRARLALR